MHHFGSIEPAEALLGQSAQGAPQLMPALALAILPGYLLHGTPWKLMAFAHLGSSYLVRAPLCGAPRTSWPTLVSGALPRCPPHGEHQDTMA